MDEGKQPLKVLCCLLDNRFGGPHRLALSAARRLRNHGIETVFLLGRKTGETWQPEDFPVFALKHLQCYQRKHTLVNLALFGFFLPYNLWRIGRIIRSNGIDIVHVDGITNFVPALAAWLARRPIVWLYNDHLPAVFEWLLLALVARLAAVVLVQGERLKEVRTGRHARLHAKTEVLYSSVDLAEFDPDRYGPEQKEQIRQELGIPHGRAVVGIIGNLNRLKGHAYFLQAAAKVKEKVQSAEFLMVGRRLNTDPGCWEQLQELIAAGGLGEQVVYTGFRRDIPAMLAITDVLVLASALESCPVVVLEAMAMRVPVVATDVGAVTEMVADGRMGWVVPPEDAEAIAHAVVDCLTTPPKRIVAMTEAARSRVEEFFALDRIVGRQKQIYESVNRPGAGVAK